jgi:hypothetical protein
LELLLLVAAAPKKQHIMETATMIGKTGEYQLGVFLIGPALKVKAARKST